MIEFVVFSLLVTVVPLLLVFWLNDHVERLSISETAKTALKVVPALFVINIAIGIYIIKAIRDPANYLKFKEPLKSKKEE